MNRKKDLACMISEEVFQKLSKRKKRQYEKCVYCGDYSLKSWSPKCICEEG